MLKFLTAIPNKLLALGAIAGLAVIALFCVDFYQNFNQTQGLSEAELLKASKEDIINYRIQNDSNDSNGQGIVVYRYVSNKEAPAETYQGLTEDLSKRTANSQAFLKSVKQIDEKTQQNEYVGRFYAGTRWQKEGEKWYQVETATTTKAAFFRQTELTLLDKAKELIGQKALADTFYSGAGDGRIGNDPSTETDWATVHDAATGTTLSDTATGLFVIVFANHAIYRSFLPFNTSAIPSNVRITSASLNLHVALVYVQTPDAYNFFNVVQASQADSAHLSLDDYSKCGATTAPITGSSNYSLNGLGVSDISMPLNATGISWIKKSGETSNCGTTAGYTCLGLREGHDIVNIESAGDSYVWFASSETSGTGDDPYLAITYTEVAPLMINGGNLKINGANLKINGSF